MQAKKFYLLVLCCLSLSLFNNCSATGSFERDSLSVVTAEDMRQIRKVALPAMVHLEIEVREGRQSGVGGCSGWIIEGGYIVTDYHCIGGTPKSRITFYEGTIAEAETIGADPWTDTAVAKLNNPTIIKQLGITPFKFGDPSKLETGDAVFALGCPAGIRNIMTAGIVSNPKGVSFGGRMGAESTVENPFIKYIRHIQHDALIFGGNSGGPLINKFGEVIGMNHAGLGSMSLAIPSDIVKLVVDNIIKQGYHDWAWLGLELQPLSSDLKKKLELLPSQYGVYVTSVKKDSPAMAAGIKGGDVIVEIDGEMVNAQEPAQVIDINLLIAKKPIGKKVNIKLLRKGVFLSFEPTTENILDGEFHPFVAQYGGLNNPRYHYNANKAGFKVLRITKSIAERWGIETLGVFVLFVQSDSDAEKAGLKPQVIITKVNDTLIKNFDEFKEMWEKIEKESDKENKVVLTIREIQPGQVGGGKEKIIILKFSK